MRNGFAGIGSIGRIPGSTAALQFQIPHSAFGIVNGFNHVDETYRTDLRELNELNFARFDAKLEERLAELRSGVAERLAELESRLTWRMFAFWAPTALAVIGTGAGVVSLLLRR